MKKPQTSWTLSVLAPVTICAWIGVAVYWVYLSFISSLSAGDVRDEGERVVEVLQQHKSARGRYPARLEDSRVADLKFPVGVLFRYTSDDTLRGYVLIVSGGGHTWRYVSALNDWQYVPAAPAPTTPTPD
jgi:hypothetical protein